MICAGLDGDIYRNKFGYLIDLIPMAEKVNKMPAICVECGIDASFTQRQPIIDNSLKNTIVNVGSQELYRPVCRGCYLAAQSDTESDRHIEYSRKNRKRYQDHLRNGNSDNKKK